MGSIVNSLGRETVPFDERFISVLCGDEESTERFFNPIKSDYQLNLERAGWEHVSNEIATNYHIGMDLPTEPIRDSLERMREDYETRICPGKRVGFFRAHDTSGERIPYPEKVPEIWKLFSKYVEIVAIYVRDK